MKIAFVSQPWNTIVPPVQNGSVAIWTYEVAKRLAESYEVTVYARRGRGQLPAEVSEGVRYRRFQAKSDDRLLRLLAKMGGGGAPQRPHFARLFAHFAYALQVAVDLRRSRCDLVQIFNVSQFVPVIRALNPKVKIVLRMSCEWMTKLDRELVGPRLRQVDRVFGCSEYITNGIRRRFPEVASRCTTIMNGRDVHRFTPASEAAAAGKDSSVKQVLFVGRISPEKGVHVLMDAFRAVARRVPDARLVLVGPESAAPASYFSGIDLEPRTAALAPLFTADYPSLVRSMIPADIAGRVEFRGFVPHYELAQLYRRADVLVLPSVVDEASGNSLIEAMATGLAVVATRTGGTPEYVENGKCGILAEPADPDSLADAIVRLLNDETLRRQMGQAGRQRAVDRFSCEQLAQSLMSQYEDVLRY